MRTGLLLSQNGARIGGVAERSGTGKHMGEGVARGFDREPLPLIWRNRDIQVIRIGGHPLDRPALAPELAADDPHACAVIVSDLGDCARWNVLIARVSHF